jgi:hypothetical protein
MDELAPQTPRELNGGCDATRFREATDTRPRRAAQRPEMPKVLSLKSAPRGARAGSLLRRGPTWCVSGACRPQRRESTREDRLLGIAVLDVTRILERGREATSVAFADNSAFAGQVGCSGDSAGVSRGVNLVSVSSLDGRRPTTYQMGRGTFVRPWARRWKRTWRS